MRALIVCASVSHGNTRRVAEAMGRVLDARVVDPADADPDDVAEHDLVGFGSGVYNLDLHPRLHDLVRSLSPGRTPTFLFATCGFPALPLGPLARRVPRTLERQGYPVLDTFRCRGFDTWLPFRVVGGLHRGRPDEGDLAAARAFADGVRARAVPAS